MFLKFHGNNDIMFKVHSTKIYLNKRKGQEETWLLETTILVFGIHKCTFLLNTNYVLLYSELLIQRHIGTEDEDTADNRSWEVYLL